MSLETTFVCKTQHFVCYTCGITYAQHTDPTVNQFLGNPVHSHIRLCTYQYLIFAV